jgi:hemoglobin-like flavoprotein
MTCPQAERTKGLRYTETKVAEIEAAETEMIAPRKPLCPGSFAPSIDRAQLILESPGGDPGEGQGNLGYSVSIRGESPEWFKHRASAEWPSVDRGSRCLVFCNVPVDARDYISCGPGQNYVSVDTRPLRIHLRELMTSYSGTVNCSPCLHDILFEASPSPAPDAKPFIPRRVASDKSTAPVLAEHGVAITTHFYKRLLDNNPELKNIFNTAHQSTGAQPAALAHAVWAYASNIDNLGALSTAVSRIGHKHASLGVRADQYPIVGENFLSSIKEVLGDAVDKPVLDAWKAAYQQLADIFIDFENNLYKKAEATPGGWKGWRKFTVSRKVHESDEIYHSISLQAIRENYPRSNLVSSSALGYTYLSRGYTNRGCTVSPISLTANISAYQLRKSLQ